MSKLIDDVPCCRVSAHSASIYAQLVAAFHINEGHVGTPRHRKIHALGHGVPHMCLHSMSGSLFFPSVALVVASIHG
jgi:hypothetical protein